MFLSRGLRCVAARQQSTLPFVHATRASKLNCASYIEACDQILAAPLAMDKERHLTRLTSMYGHVPTDEVVFHVMRAHASDHNFDRVLAMVTQCGAAGRRPLPGDVLSALAQCFVHIQGMLPDGLRTTPNLADDLVLGLWRAVAVVQGTHPVPPALSMMAMQCLALAGHVSGLQEILRYMSRGGATTPAQLVEVLATAVYGIRVSGDLTALDKLAIDFPSLPTGGLGVASVYYVEALTALGRIAVAKDLLVAFPTGTTDSHVLTVSDVRYEHSVLSCADAAALQELVPKDPADDRRTSIVVQAMFSHRSVAQTLEWLLSLGRKVVGPLTMEAVCEGVVKGLDGLEAKSVISSLEPLKLTPHAHSGRNTFTAGAPETVEAVTGMLLRLADFDSLLIYLLHVAETDHISGLSSELYTKVWAEARDAGHWKLSVHLRHCKSLMHPLRK